MKLEQNLGNSCYYSVQKLTSVILNTHACMHIHLFIHSFIYLHSMNPYMTGRPVDREIVNDNKTNHINYVNKNSITITHVI
jgi:hypothetical protein